MTPTLRSTLAVFGLCAIMLLSANAEAQDSAKAPQRPARRVNPALRQVDDVEGLPRVLLIGDSISMGYTVPVREMLEGKANVHRPKANCGPTTRGLTGLEAWLGEGRWDVIHFNWGLHDLKYLGAQGQNLADPKAADSRQQVPPEQYEANLQKLVQRMKKTGAKLIWCSTTPVPKGAQGRVKGDAARYNEIALRVMKEHDVAVNDLYAFALPKLKEIQKPANVHFTPEGSRALASKVVDEIEAALPNESKKK